MHQTRCLPLFSYSSLFGFFDVVGVSMTDLGVSMADLDVLLDDIAGALQRPGYCILDNCIPHGLADRLREELQTGFCSLLQPAGVGRGGGFQRNQDIRRDKIHWLEPVTPAVTEFLSWMDRLRTGLNQRLFLGLVDFECHFAVYGPGDFYQKHLDAFRGARGRRVSTVFYLNSDWATVDAGELVLYDEAGEQILEQVAPKNGRLVIFLSEEFPHEVRPANRQRFSIAGWFRVNPF